MTLAERRAERERHIESTLSALKSLADTTTTGNPRAVAERLIAKGVVLGLHGVDTQKFANTGTVRSAIALASDAEKKLGPDWVDHEPETLVEAMGWSTTEVAAALAAKLVLYDTGAFTDWHHFEKLSLALCQSPVVFDRTQRPHPVQMAWAADQMRLIDPVTPWGDEVGAYVASQLSYWGFASAPTPLAFADASLQSCQSSIGRELASTYEQECGPYLQEAAEYERSRHHEIFDFVNFMHQQLARELGER
jgi:hypothetical protein